MNRHQFARSNISGFKQQGLVDYFDLILHGPGPKFKQPFSAQTNTNWLL